MGVVNDIVRERAAIKVTPLMLALFPLGQHRALVAMWEILFTDEQLMAFLDDIDKVRKADRVVHIRTMLRAQLWHHSRIQMHLGKTQAWNRGCVEFFLSTHEQWCGEGT